MGVGLLEPAAEVVERERELERIAAVLDRAAQGAGSLLFVEGEAGIGKTALLEWGRSSGSNRGMLVLSARATELEREYPFGLVRQLLDPVLRSARGRRRERLLDGVGDATALWPALGGEQVGQASEFTTLNGLWWLLANLAEEQPVMATVDDLHWCDEESLRFLRFMAPRVGELPLALVVAARGEQLPGRLTEAGWGPPMVPAPLSAAGCAAVAHETFRRPVDGSFCAACHEATGGNPFYLHALLDELVRDRVEPVAAMADQVLGLRPSTVANAIAARLATVPADAVALARALAILGEGAPAGQLEALARLHPVAIAEASEWLVRAGILAPGGELRFTHPIVGGAIEGDMSAGERDTLHRRSAALLASLGAPAEQTAAQLLACRPEGDADAVGVLAAAARQALERGAARSAVGYLRRAVAEPPERPARASLLSELALAELRLDGEGAVEHLREALALAQPEQRPTVGAILAAALLAVNGAREAEAAAAAAEALSGLPDEDRETRRFLQATMLLCAQIAPALEWARDQVRSNLAGLEHEPGLGARMLEAVVALDDARQMTAPARALAARLQRTLADGCLLSAEAGIAMGFGTALPVVAMANPDVAVSLVDKGLEAARRQGDVHSLAALRLHSCLARTLHGDLPEAVADGTQGLELSSTWGTNFALEWGSAFVAVAKLEAGDLDGAERLLSRVAPIGAELRQHADSLTLLDSRARLHLARGRFRACLDDAAELEQRAGALGWLNPAFYPWRSYTAECLTALDEQPERARGLAGEEVELARRWGAPLALGAALRGQALVAEGNMGEEHLREAVEILEGSPARLEHVRALVGLGALLRRDGRRIEARPPLRSGLDLARACGATPLAERAYHELRATGASPRKLTRTGLATLTASERRVAQMAAAGKTNKQIAQELYVTVKTVESHLAGAYRKLDITTRTELARKLGSDPFASPLATAAAAPASPD